MLLTRHWKTGMFDYNVYFRTNVDVLCVKLKCVILGIFSWDYYLGKPSRKSGNRRKRDRTNTELDAGCLVVEVRRLYFKVEIHTTIEQFFVQAMSKTQTKS